MSIIYFSTQQLENEVLARSSQDELLAITRIFSADAKSADEPKALAAKVCEAGGHSIGNWLRSQGIPYSELLHDVAQLLAVPDIQPLKVVTPSGLTVAEMDSRALNAVLSPEVAAKCRRRIIEYITIHENAVLSKFSTDAYERMSKQQRIDVDKQVLEVTKRAQGLSTGAIGTSAALLATASVSGFAPYMLLSTVISTVTGGVAGFSVYTAASSALHLLIGPPGWAALGAAAVYKLGGPNEQKCLKAVLAIALLRGRLQYSAVKFIK